MCDVAWYVDFLEANPAARKWRDVVVVYAEKRGGVVEEYLRLLYPRFWLKVEDVPLGTEGQLLGLTPAEELQIILDMIKEVLPMWRSAPERSTFTTTSDLRFPATVRHFDDISTLASRPMR